MDGIVIFSKGNTHPLAFLLTRKRRHVFCAVRDVERGFWVSYDWHQGVPILKVQADADFDLKSFYLNEGYEVLDITVGDVASSWPLQWNNCVGHVKTILGIRSWSCVPNGLYKYLMRREGDRLGFFNWFTVPGFGSKSAPAPTHYSDGTPIGATPAQPAKKATKSTTKTDPKKRKPVASQDDVGLGDLGGTSDEGGTGTLLK